MPGRRPGPPVVRRGPPAAVAGDGTGKGPAVSNESAGGSAPGPDNTATAKIPLAPPSGDREPPVSADDFQPDMPAHEFRPTCSRPPMPNSDRWRSRRRSQRHDADAGVRSAPLGLRRRSHPRIAALRRAARAAHRGGHLGRGRPSHPRRGHRRRPLPAARLPRRAADPAVLAGARHRAGPAGRADLRRPRRDALRRAVAEDPGAHSQAEPTRHARRRPRPRRRQHRVGRSGGRPSGFAADPWPRSPKRHRPRSAARGRFNRWRPPPRQPTARVSHCRSITPAACG